MSLVSRRTVLRSAALAAGATAVQPTVQAAAASITDPLSRARFTAQLGATFTLTKAGTSIKAVLMTVEDLTPTKVPGDDRNYRLTFSAKSAGPAQGTVSVSRPGFTTTPLFLVPDVARRSYGAVVARG